MVMMARCTFLTAHVIVIYVRIMRVVYEIMRDSRALIDPLWKMVDDYVEMSRTDKIKYAMAAREAPEIRAYVLGVVEDLDERLSITYDFDGALDAAAWKDMDLTSRLLNLRECTFKYSYIHGFRDIYSYDIINLSVAIELINDIVCDSGWWRIGRNDPSSEIKYLFASAMFDDYISRGCKK